MNWEALETERLSIQTQLDEQKTGAERNRLGQFATPTALAREILGYGLKLLGPDEPIRFLDPAIGTGSFYSALRSVAGARPVERALGFEIDPHYGEPASKLWARSGLTIEPSDFTAAATPGSDHERPNLLICNPPYVRHHHIDREMKVHLQVASERACGVRVQGLAGLYCYFLALSHAWMAKGGVAAWLIPSEFMDVNYGEAVKRYLSTKVTLLRIHRFDPNDVQFGDALVSSAIVWIRNTPPSTGHQVEFTYGGTLGEPRDSARLAISDLRTTEKWTRYPREAGKVRQTGTTLGDLFKIRRGIATGDNGFFVLTPEAAAGLNLPPQFLKPILPGTRHLPDDEIQADEWGFPRIDRKLVLLDCGLTEAIVREQYPSLWAYLQTGRGGSNAVADRYLCRHRDPWYAQEKRAPAPILCTYMGRSDRQGRRPFRFFLNHSQAIAGNVYLMLYPKPAFEIAAKRNPALLRLVWESLNRLDTQSLLGEGRVYGGGLHKLEPKELANVVLPELEAIEPQLVGVEAPQPDLFEREVA